MAGRIPDPGSAYEDEGLPDLDPSIASKRITGDAQDDLPVPGDDAVAVDDWGTTAAEQFEGEPLDLRLAREEPDEVGGDVDELTAETETPFEAASEGRVGRLVEYDEGAHPDVEPDAVALDVGTDAGGMTAEEQAMHVEEA